MKNKLLLIGALFLSIGFTHNIHVSATETEDTNYPVVNIKEDQTNLPQSDTIMYNENKNLSEDDIAKRFIEINEKYEINQPFSNEDAEFVVTYSEKTESENNNLSRGLHFYKGTTSKNFNTSKTSQGVKVTFSGNVKTHINAINVSDQWYSGKTTAKINSGSSKVKSIKTVITNATYGFIGNSGTYIGLVNSSSLTSSSGAKSTANYLDKKHKYTAILATYTYVTTYVTVNTSQGSFNLHAF